MMRWTVCLDGGPRRVNHAAVSIGNWIYSFGGYCTGDDYEKVRPIDVHVLNTVTLRWTLLPLPSTPEHIARAPYQRYGHTAVEYDSKAFIWGGRNDREGPCNTLFLYEGATNEWSLPEVTGTIPGARDGHSACVIKHCMYVFAGYEEFTNRFSNDMNYIDLRTFQWVSVVTKGEPARWRDFHTATAVGDMMYIFGGRCDEGGDQFTNSEVYCNKLVAYNTASKTWLDLDILPENIPQGRRSHSAFANRNCLYIFGGYNGIHSLHYNDLHMLDLKSMQWREIKLPGYCPPPCRRQCCCVVGSKVYFFGGTSPTNEHQQSNVLEDLTDRSDVFILDLNPSLKTLACMVIMENELDCSALPHDLRWELSVMTSNNTISISSSNSSLQLQGIEPL